MWSVSKWKYNQQCKTEREGARERERDRQTDRRHRERGGGKADCYTLIVFCCESLPHGAIGEKERERERQRDRGTDRERQRERDRERELTAIP